MMYRGYQIEQKRNEKIGGRETTISQMMKIVGNQAMVQMDPGKKKRTRQEDEKPKKRRKVYDDDDEFILDMEFAKEEEEHELWETIAMEEANKLSPENVPQKLIYVPKGKDCFKETFEYSNVHINMTGTRRNDNKEADNLLSQRDKSYTGRHEEFTWHHMATNTIEECDMILVNTMEHSKIRHVGAVQQYERYKRNKGQVGFKYG